MFGTQDTYWWEGGRKVAAGNPFDTVRLTTELDRLTRRASGRRSRTHTDRKRGRYIQARPARPRENDVAFDATLRAAAPHQRARAAQRAASGLAYTLHRTDLQRKVRVKRAANLILFAVDASWSMAVSERMAATKGAILSLLTDAYQRRDRVGLVVFQKDRATLVLPPTHSVVLATRALADIPVGGKTPLAAGLSLCYNTIRREQTLDADVMPLLVLLTDGAGNVSLGDASPQDEAHRLAARIREVGIRSITINMEHAAFDQGLAAKLAEHLGGPCYTLAQINAGALVKTVRAALDG